MAEEITYELFTRRFDQLNEMHRELRADIRALGESMLQLSRQSRTSIDASATWIAA